MAQPSARQFDTPTYSFLSNTTLTNSYTYDAAQNRTGFTDPESGATTYGYHTLNRLSTLTPPSACTTGEGSSSFRFSYDALRVGRRPVVSEANP